MTLVLAVDPGTRESAYVIVDAALRPVEFQKISNAELLDRIEGAPHSRTRWSHLTACAIEMPAAAGYAGTELFDTCRHVGNFEHAWRAAWRARRERMETRWQAVFADAIALITRNRVKLHLRGRANEKGSDKLIRAALIAKHGGPAAIKRGGELHGVTGDCWAALAVAHTFLEAVQGGPPGQADAAFTQNRILWNTGTQQLDESPKQARARRAREVG